MSSPDESSSPTRVSSPDASSNPIRISSMGEVDTVARSPGAQPSADANESSVPRGTMLGRYVVIDQLGAGGMGVVYAAYDPELNRRVALKLIRPPATNSDDDASASVELRSRLLREAQALAKLTHPNVVTVYDVGEVDGSVFIAMEHVLGATFRAWTKAETRGWRDILAIAVDAGRGLAAAHRAGLIHRDFKPDNVLVDTQGRAYVVDFGLARADDQGPADDLDLASAKMRESAANESAYASIPATSPSSRLSPCANLTEAGTVMGTPAYMAPEQFAGHTDARADQFAFCVALFEMLTGQRPFVGRPARDLASALTREKLSFPDDRRVPRFVRDVITRGLENDPKRRFASMDDLLEALTRDPWRRVRVAASVLAAAAIVGGGSWTYHRVENAAFERCVSGSAAMRSTWNAERHATISSAFAALDIPFATRAWQTSAAVLDRYASEWIDARTNACEATHRRGEQSPELLDRRIACLDKRMGRMSALLDTVETPDERTVGKILNAVYDLPAIDYCADSDALLAAVAPPEDPNARAEVEAIQTEIAKLKAAVLSSQFRSVPERVAALIERAKPLDYGPILSELYEISAHDRIDAGQPDTAAQQLRQAIYQAERAGAFEPAASAAIALLWTDGYMGRRFDAIDDLEWHARGLVEAAGSPPRLLVKLHYILATTNATRGKHDACIDEIETTLKLARELFRPEDPRISRMLHVLAMCTSRPTAEATDKAVALLRQVEQRHRDTWHGVHPDMALAASNIVEVLTAGGRYRDALAEAERGILLWRELGQTSDPHAVFAGYVKASVLHQLGQPDAALELMAPLRQRLEQTDFGCDGHFDSFGIPQIIGALLDKGERETAWGLASRAVTACTNTLGDAHPDVAQLREALAEAALARGDHHTASELAQGVIRARDGEGPNAGDGGYRARTLLARAQLAAGEITTALSTAKQALEAGQAFFGTKHPTMVIGWHAQALALAAAGQISSARESYRHAIDLLHATVGDENPRLVALYVELAELEQEHHDFAAARTWAKRARAAFAPDANDPALLARIDRVVADLDRENGRRDAWD